MPLQPSDGDWSAYNAEQRGRGPRSLTVRAAELARPGDGRVAVELGSGSGVDSRFLEAYGWQVHSYDADPESSGGVHHSVADLSTLDDLPRAALVLSNATLSFLQQEDLKRLLNLVGERLVPSGVFAADFWGPQDDWASGPGTYLDQARLRSLLPWLSAPGIQEREWDGTSFGGAKHWHVLTVLGQRTP